MPTFHICIVNSDFESSNECEAANQEDARTHALRAALNIGVDEVCKGSPFFGAEVRIKVDGDVKERFMVGMGQSPLREQ